MVNLTPNKARGHSELHFGLCWTPDGDASSRLHQGRIKQQYKIILKRTPLRYAPVPPPKVPQTSGKLEPQPDLRVISEEPVRQTKSTKGTVKNGPIHRVKKT